MQTPADTCSLDARQVTPDKERNTSVQIPSGPAFSPSHLLWQVAQLGMAYALALPVGWNREKESHAAGIRTFPIIAVASCALAMMAVSLPGATPDTYSRILQGLVTGIGFVGGGAILRSNSGVTGVATAASVWSTGIAGAAVGLGLYHIAIVLTVLTYLTLRFLTPSAPPE